MAFELREKNGSIFENNYKKADNHPDYKGELLVGGIPSNIALWKKKDKNGKLFFGFVISDKLIKTPVNTTPPAKDADGNPLPF